MEKFSNEYFKKLAHGLMFDVNEQEIEELRRDFETLEEQLALFNVIDTKDVEPMIYPFEFETSFLRKDVDNHRVTQNEALLNARESVDGLIVVPKVVK